MATWPGRLLSAAIVGLLATALYQLRPTDSGSQMISRFTKNIVRTFTTGKMGDSNAEPSRFRKVQNFKTDYATTTVTQYESERSGMQVIVADRKGPKINGYFTLATEIFDDSGSPHTLEHLVFMGSRSFKYKGLLDKLASRAYSNTNAWTAVDHTAYTLESAGWDGFAQILPVYLEHLIVPNITEDACITEVHHIDGEGNDAGVVYSEMQALQWSSTELMDLRARRLLYPENVGFRYETGGMMEALRELTTERITQFHKTMYHPRNLAIIIVGETDHDDLLKILGKFEQSLDDVIPPLSAPFKRPWIDSPQPPPLKETVVETVKFPEDDESIGEIVIGFFGPPCTDVIATSALNVLLTYLCGSSVSILENIIVEKEELASSVSCWWDSRPNSMIWFQPTGVATEKLAFVEKRVFELLKDVASKPLDMEYMQECIHRELRQVKFQAEDSEQFYSSNIINDFLFGKRDGSTLLDLASLHYYDTISKWTDGQWRDFLRQWISDAHHVSILGEPSAEMAKELKATEEARVAKRKEELGEAGLKKLHDRLEEAKKANDIAIPDSVLDQWEVPGTESIHFIESATARSGHAKELGVVDNQAQKVINAADKGKSPLFVQFEDVPSNFVHVTLHVGTAQVPVALKPLLSLFADNFFNSPVNKADGTRIEFEEVVKELERQTISYQLNSAGRLGDPEGIIIQFQFEPDKYAIVIDWIRTLLFDSIFDPRRLGACVSKALADIPENKRDGRLMAQEVDMAVHMQPKSYSMARRNLVKAVYLRRLRKLIKADPDTVVGWFEELRKSLLSFNNARVLVTADVTKLANPVTAWDALSASLSPAPDSPMLLIPPPHALLNKEGLAPGSHGATIIPLTTLDSSYSVSTTTGLTSFSDPRLPAFLVAVNYLDAVEGPLWNAVRGNGLAYGVGFSRECDSGVVQFRVYRSPDASRAIDASREAVRVLAEGEKELERHLLEGAVSGVVSGFADERATMASAAQTNFIRGVVRGLEEGWAVDVMKRVRDVKREEVRRVMKELIMPVFGAGTSNVVVTCAPLMQESIEKALTATGYKTQVQPLSAFHDDYGLKGGEDDDEPGDDEEVEDEDDDSEESGSDEDMSD